MPFKQGEIPEGATPFKEGNPGGPGRPLGVKNRSTIARKVLEMRALFNADTFKELQAQYPEITKESTAEEIMTIVHLDKAIKDKDSNSYKAIMDSAYGAPKQEVEAKNINYNSAEMTKDEIKQIAKDLEDSV